MKGKIDERKYHIVGVWYMYIKRYNLVMITHVDEEGIRVVQL